MKNYDAIAVRANRSVDWGSCVVKLTSIIFMNRGKTGCFVIAMTGRWGQTSGTATVAGKSVNLGSSSSSSGSVANDLADDKNDVGNFVLVSATADPDDTTLRSMNRRGYRDDRLMEYWRLDVKLLCRCFGWVKRFNLEFLNTTRSSEFIFYCYLSPFVWAIKQKIIKIRRTDSSRITRTTSYMRFLHIHTRANNVNE